jgi:F-type H+-transporting ATPase subunit a
MCGTYAYGKIMVGFELFSAHRWNLLGWLGITHPLLAVQVDTVIYTWISLVIILLFAFYGRYLIVHKPQSMGGYLLQKYIGFISDLVTQSYGRLYEPAVSFFVALGTFLVVCNCLVLIPTMEEPTKDLNTTLGLALLTFLYIQWHSLRAHGLIEYAQEYLVMPLAVRGVYTTWDFASLIGVSIRIIVNAIVGIALLPIELLGKFSSVLSLSFRLFGNILAGSVIAALWLQLRSRSIIWQIFGLVSGINIIITLFFGLFEGTVQAAVFTILGISYLGRAVQKQH